MAWYRCGGGSNVLKIPVLVLAQKGSVAYYINSTNTETGGTMFENSWKKLNIEKFGLSQADGNGYPKATSTSINVKIIGFNSLEENGTELLTTKTSVSNLNISGYKYIKIVAEKSNTSGDTFSAVNVLFS